MPSTRASGAASPTRTASTLKPLAPALAEPTIDLLDGRLHPPAGLRATTVGHSGHTHGEPTDCADCAATLRAEGWATPAQHQHRAAQAIDEELRRRERARVLGLDLPL